VLRDLQLRLMQSTTARHAARLSDELPKKTPFLHEKAGGLAEK